MKLLKIELAEHNEVEKELAKRSHFCNRVIQKYKAQIKMLKEEIKEREDLIAATDQTSNLDSSSIGYKKNRATTKTSL
jgi:hypothetical protein